MNGTLDEQFELYQTMLEKELKYQEKLRQKIAEQMRQLDALMKSVEKQETNESE